MRNPFRGTAIGSTLVALAAWTLLSVSAIAGTFSSLLETRFQEGLADVTGTEAEQTLAVVQAVYAKDSYTPLWVTREGADVRARELAQALGALRLDGLDPEDYGLSTLERLLGETRADKLVELEVRLSLGLVQAASDLASGRLQPRAVNPKLYIYPQDVDKAAVLTQARDEEEIAAFLQSFQPSQANYHRLKSALAGYRRLALGPKSPPIKAGKTLDLGRQSERVDRLRARLATLGDYSETVAAGIPFDHILEQAVKRFQYRHGLTVDGRVGPKTLAALNVPIRDRVTQMLLNMERRRWMPDTFEKRYVFVNLADFELKVVDTIEGRERTIHTTEVVVGKPFHQTPEFSHQIRYLVINPYWNVPSSIARNELLPKFKKDLGVIAEKGYELLEDWTRNAKLVDPASIDWGSVTRRSFKFRIRQSPGPLNALGQIKFIFPNRHNIYLHDTPARSLFDRTERAFSHGCIRVKAPDVLAGTLLQWQDGWPLSRIHNTIESGTRTVVSLKKPVPVHLAYVTAWVNKDGTVHFREDIYKRDAVLKKALLH